MAYQLDDSDLQVFQLQQLTMLRNQLIQHLLGLPNPPTDWQQLEKPLSEQIRVLRKLGFIDAESLKMTIEALHYQPDLLDSEPAKKILAEDLSPWFKAEALLELARS